jgi:hypothetical protein
MSKKTKNSLANCITITSYAALDTKLGVFVRGNHMRAVTIISRAGLQKSTMIAKIMPDAAVLQGRVTAYGLYKFCYANRDRDIVLDDCDNLDSKPEAIAILKALTDTRKRRSTICWNSATPEIRSGELPDRFSTTSRLVILANQWDAIGSDVQAVVDRCNYFIHFKPSNLEVHKRVAGFLADQEVFDFIGEHLSYACNLSMRDYVKAQAAKLDGDPDWARDLLSRWLDSEDKRIVAQLLSDASLSTEAMITEYKKQTGKSRAKFYRVKSQLPEQVSAPKILLPRTNGPVVTEMRLPVVEILRQTETNRVASLP